uniref:Uncharacterized protein n=1 Tax=Daucus carota subsp. sativus TaxID=79200 RepID=A0A161ZHL4_DAUCS
MGSPFPMYLAKMGSEMDAQGELCQVVDALDLAQAKMTKVHQNLSWAVVYNVVAVLIAAGVLPHSDFAMTPSLSDSVFVCISTGFTWHIFFTMDGSSKKRGRLKLCLTKEVAEERGAVRRLQNAARRDPCIVSLVCPWDV